MRVFEKNYFVTLATLAHNAMQAKKTEKANLENKKLLFFQIGLIVALGLCLAAFEWKTGEKRQSFYTGMREQAIEAEQVPLTEEQVPQQAPPPELTVTDLFEIVEDNVVVTSDATFENDETDEDKSVEISLPSIDIGEEETEEEIFTIVEDYPTFRGKGLEEFQMWVQKRIRYPDEAMENRIEGRVILTFVVETDGSVSNVEIVRSVNPLIDEVAKLAVADSPRWQPGMQRGRAVRVRYSIPITFKLSD